MNVAIYARVSTTRQADNDLSIPDQLRQLNEWCKANGHLVVHEYIEPGASATDDKRPIFQQLIHDAEQKPPAFEAIIIHSLSRFFRDVVQFGVYERNLKKNKVNVISITQITTDDAAGEMMRRIMSTFDEYNSKENSKHTSRAMCENARQGYFNGSKAPFGYQSISTVTHGSRGRKKKKLQINESESDVVKRIYELYQNGENGKSVGVKQIAVHLNELGLRMRGDLWRRQKIQSILSDSLYMGEYYFNVLSSKTGEKRLPSEWIKTDIPQIINPLLFEQIRLKRESRKPSNSNPRALSSPCLLTGILKCGHCGATLTLATGKGGRYRYYKCTNRRNKGNVACISKNLPMEKVDKIILNSLAEKAFSADRIQSLISEFRSNQQTRQGKTQQQHNLIQRELDQLDIRQRRLFDAVENGTFDSDDLLRERTQEIKTRRDALKIELANFTRQPSFDLSPLRASQIEKVSNMLKAKLINGDKEVARSYVHLLVDEIKVIDNQAMIQGNVKALIAATASENKNGHLKQVPTSISNWGG